MKTLPSPLLAASFFSVLLLVGGVRGQTASAPVLPAVPAELKVELFASEPLVRNPCAMAFDARGRLFVGQGPQYRSPKPDTPGDSVVILIDSDGDGIADRTKTFASGLNCIQGLAWHGRDLWIANSPDLTIARDLDGDDEADEYVLVYTDLGNLEHAIHGLNWAPDGKLYFSKGNSKGLNRPERVAPKPFRELWGLSGPPDAPDFPPPQVFKKADYKHSYQDPGDNWGREGGVLRCDDLGRNLEIFSRGMRNPWDINFDSGFNWLGTDNDQNDGDRILMPFRGAHFGWAHAWSANWTGENHPPTAPVSGPVFHGSGTGIVYYDLPQMPAGFRGVWFINDWLRKTTFVYRPRWDGTLLQPDGGKWQEFARGRTALYEPVDIEIGPDGALYLTGWGSSYGAVWKNGEQANEGRVFRISWPAAPQAKWNTPKRTKPLADWTFAELVEDLGSAVRVWSVDAQDELVRRGPAIASELMARIERGHMPTAQETWALWALGRIKAADRNIDEWFAAKGGALSPNARLQSIAIAADRSSARHGDGQLPEFVHAALADPEPRVRFAAVQAFAQARPGDAIERLSSLAAIETDRLTFYATWQALRQLATSARLQELLRDARPGVRRAALLALLENDALDRSTVTTLVNDRDVSTAGIAALWLAKQNGNSLVVIEPAPGDFADQLEIRLTAGIKPAAMRWTLDGSEPTPPAPRERERDSGRITIKDTTKLKVALFVPDRQPGKPVEYRKVGNTLEATWTRRELAPATLIALEPPAQPLSIDAVLPLVKSGDEAHGPQLFRAAGCVACHRVNGEGQAFGPDLRAMGDKADARHVVESLLQPNAIVAEGFALLTVATRDGKTFAGVLKEETNRVLALVQPNAQPVSIEKENITRRESSHASIMPSFERVMSARQMADLAAWLLSLGSEASHETPPSVAPGKSAAFTWEMKGDRCVITANGRPVADFVFKDSETLRPHWQNIHAPDGTQVTRRHPPAAPEATDHAALHPGLWMAFGDVNGQDFWRNKARIEHVRFSEPPALHEGRLRFTTENNLVAQNSEIIGTQRLRFELWREGPAYWISCDTVLKPGARELVFGDQEEMGFGVRLTAALIEKNGGGVVNSAGVRGAKTAWGKVADWCDYAGTLDGRKVGVTLFAHPENPYRSWWHSRDYGLLSANPFGPRVLPAQAGGKLVIKPGEELRLRFAALFYSTASSSPVDPEGAYRAYSSRAARP